MRRAWKRAWHWLDTFEVAPIWRRRVGILLIPLTLILWAGSAVWWARDEPQFILGLSWLAVTFTAIDIAFTADVRVQQETSVDPDQTPGSASPHAD